VDFYEKSRVLFFAEIFLGTENFDMFCKK